MTDSHMVCDSGRWVPSEMLSAGLGDDEREQVLISMKVDRVY